MEYQHLLFEQQEAVVKVTLNRPERLNALNARLRAEIVQVMQACQEDDDVRVVIITGTGRAFCAGDDVRASSDPGEPASPTGGSLYSLLHTSGFVPVIRAIRNIEKPVIAMVNGLAYGGGFEITMASDFCVASEDATFCTPYLNRGFAAGTFLLPRYLGLRKASEMIFLGEPISASEAEALGLANQVVPADALESAVQELAGKLATRATRAIGAAKWALNQGMGASLEEAWQYDSLSNLQTRNTDDVVEGRRAFAEKREPVFRGR